MEGDFVMWIFFGSIVIIGFLAIILYLGWQNKKLNQEVALLKPLVETADNIRDILYYCETVPKLKYIYLSQSVDKFFGPGTMEAHLREPDKIFELVHPDDKETLLKKKQGTLNFDDPIQVRFRNHLGQYIWFEEHATPTFKNGKLIAVQGIFRNVNDKKVLQEALEYKSTHDVLTDLYNRDYFEARMEDYNHRNVPVTIAIVDLDNLKEVNDRYGHQMGDHLLRETASLLQAKATKEMTTARIGGDEFAIIFPHASRSEVEDYIETIQAMMQIENRNLPYSTIKISIGYASSNSSYGTMEHLLHKADTIMYENKKMKKQII